MAASTSKTKKPSSRRTSNRRWLVVAIIAIVLVGFAAVWAWGKNKTAENVNETQAANTSTSQGQKVVRESVAVLYEPIEDALELADFIESKQGQQISIVRPDSIPEGDVLLPIELYLPSGESLKSFQVVDGQIVAIVLLPPQGCVFDASQRRNIGFLVVSEDSAKTFVSPVQVRIVEEQNQASCPTN